MRLREGTICSRVSGAEIAVVVELAMTGLQGGRVENDGQWI